MKAIASVVRRRRVLGTGVIVLFTAIVLAAVEVFAPAPPKPRRSTRVSAGMSLSDRALVSGASDATGRPPVAQGGVVPGSQPDGGVPGVHPGTSPHGSQAFDISPDNTPTAAAAGTEPSSMAPLSGVPAGWVTSVHRFLVGSLTRSYLMIRPGSTTGPKLPVVVILHGRGLTPAGVERFTEMPATTGPAIEVYPAGYGRSWNAGGCCGQAHFANINDVAFIADTVHRVLTSQHDADPGRVYVIGYSNGGRMAFRMACAEPGMWAGAAAVEAVPVAPCPAPTPVPMFVVASQHDPLLTIDNGFPLKTMQGYLEPTVQTTITQWRTLDGCSPAASKTVLGVATVQTWDACKGAGRVAFALYKGGSHAWPIGVTGPNPTPSAERLVWGWLDSGRLPAAAA